ncbi:unnamed protein product, partial [Ectocarpus fasciculatus]
SAPRGETSDGLVLAPAPASPLSCNGNSSSDTWETGFDRARGGGGAGSGPGRRPSAPRGEISDGLVQAPAPASPLLCNGNSSSDTWETGFDRARGGGGAGSGPGATEQAPGRATV